MSIQFPTFEDKEIPSPEKFNDFIQALEAKFAAGLGSAEIQWPLVAAGSLVIGSHSILGGREIFGVVNAANASSFGAALTAGAGGLVFIPPNTTLEISGEELVGARCAIVGAGPSSILRVVASPMASFMLRNAQSGASVLIANLTFDGRASAGGSGLVLRNVTRAILHGITFLDFAQPALVLTNDGGPGNASQRVMVSDCRFTGGTRHIHADDAREVYVTGCFFDTASGKTIDMEPASGASAMRNINISGCTIQTPGAEAISVVGGAGIPGIVYENVVIQGNTVRDGAITVPAIRAGNTGQLFSRLSIVNNNIRTAGIGIAAHGIDASITGNTVRSTDTCIDTEESENAVIMGNALHSEADMCADTSDVTVAAQVVGNALTFFTRAYRLGNKGQARNNAGVDDYWWSGVAGPFEITLPAGRLEPGDIIRASRACRNDGGPTGDLRLMVDGKQAVIIAGISSGQNGAFEARCYVVSDTEMRVSALVNNTGGWGQVTSVVTGLDFAAPLLISSDNAGWASSFNHGLSIEYLGKVEV